MALPLLRLMPIDIVDVIVVVDVTSIVDVGAVNDTKMIDAMYVTVVIDADCVHDR